MQPELQRLTAAGLNLIAQALTIFDADLRLVVSNAQLQTMFNLPDDLVRPGARFEDIIRCVALQGDYGEIEDIDELVQERVSTARAFTAHYVERVRADGSVISIEGSPLPQGGWVTVYTDITQTRRQEALLRARASELSEQVVGHSEALAASNRQLAATNAALEEAKRQLTESEARIRHTTEMMPAHIAHVDANGRYTFSNRRLNAILPGRPSDVVGLSFETAVGSEAFAKIQPNLNRAFRGRPSVFEFTHEVSGSRIRVAFNPDSEGGVYIMSMDVTEETQARSALQQTRRRELAAQLTSGLAHDFSNLLTIILGLQSKLKGLDGLSDEAVSLVDSTQAATRRGGKLLDSISNVTASRTLRPSAVNIPQLLEDLAILAAPTLPDGITLQIDNEIDERPLLVDGGQLQDGLLNLVLNARDACGTHGTIIVRARAVGGIWLDISVSDTGPGFSENALRHALDPFFTTKGAEGSGLGLPMVFDMAKLAGGDLRVGNSGNGGAIVSFRVPLRLAPSTGDGLALLVEDEEDLRAMCRDMLVSLGYSVIEAVSVDEALALLADVPDIKMVLSDLRLEGEATGIDLAKRTANDTPTVLMTSLPTSDPLHQAAIRLAPVLTKPIEISELHPLLQREMAK